jgi:hypothetical protein
VSIHILRTPGYHVGYVRGIGCRNWRRVTGKHKRAESALAAAVRKMERDDKRACVMFVPTGETGMYYEPHMEMEANRI